MMGKKAQKMPEDLSLFVKDVSFQYEGPESPFCSG